MTTITEAIAIAVQHHQAGRLQAAEQIYRQILAVDPNQVDALHLLGVIASQVGQHEIAVEYISRAIELNGTESAFHSNLGDAFKAQGKLDKAVTSYGRALELKPDNAVAHRNLGNTFQDQGKLEEAVACFRRALELNPVHAEAHNNLGTALQAQGKLDEAIDSYRQALTLKPDLPQAQNNVGNAFKDQGKLDEAVACFRQALELKPDYAEAHNNLGNAFQVQEKLDEAVTCCRRALALKPDYAAAHYNLGNALQDQGKLDEAVDSYRRALALKPDLAEAHNNLGNAFKEQRKLDEAAGCYRQALELKPDFSLAHYNQSSLRLQQGDFERGWPEHEWRWKTNQLIEREFSQPVWDGDPLEKRTILLHAEQGLGDTFQFVRYAALVKKQNEAATVIVECQRLLKKLLANCPGIDRLIAQGDDLPPFDVHSPLLSLPRIVKTTINTIPSNVPYLFAEPALVAQWRERLSHVRGLRIGISWQVRTAHGALRNRNIPLEHFGTLAQLEGISLVSLQKGEGSGDLLAAGKRLPILNLGPDFDTVHGAFMDTAAIMKNLDLVISCCTSIPHLAGALGVPVWVALAYVPDWRWLLDRDDCPWYPTMRLFRQKSPGDWPGVFNEIQDALRQLLKTA